MPAENGGGKGCCYHFVLYIDSEKPRSAYVVRRLRELCKEHLLDSYALDVVDLRDNHALFEEKKIIAVPTLEVTTPESQQHRFVGDLSQSEVFIVAVGMGQEAGRMGRQAKSMGQKAISMRSRVKFPHGKDK
jgi:isopentenyl diphosphate isomerase/L-lactate dehydrogenase-like FMN-dependent dehydrogenase